MAASRPGPGSAVPARRSTRARPAFGDLVVPALDAIVEGAWIALVYATLQVGLAHGPAVLGILAFIVAAAAGLAWARLAVGRAARPWAGAALALAFGVAGWLADPAARSMLAGALAGADGAAGLDSAMTTNAAGWLLALAVIRGAAHRERARDEERVQRLLGRILLLSIPWAIGLAFGQASREAFVAQALVATVLFTGAGLLAVGLGRLETLGASAGVDWRANRAWVAVAALVVGVVVLVSVPAAFLVGVTPAALLDAASIPLAAIAGVIAVVFAAAAAPILSGWEALMSALPTPAPTPVPSAASSLAPGGGVIPPAEGDPRVGLTLAILALVALAVGLVFVAWRIRVGAARPPASGTAAPPAEERTFEAPRLATRLPSIRIPGRRGTPKTAAAAYLALLDDLDGDAALARRPAESPRRHARRLMGRVGAGPASAGTPPEAPPSVWVDPTARIVPVGAGTAGPDWRVAPGEPARLAEAAAQRRTAEALRDAASAASTRPRVTQAASDPGTRRDLSLLVADWELARYGQRTITAAEDARGVARWRRLRRALRSAPASREARP